jgi:succinate dehydrogenase/fumarate reductase flavoprotein subunit
VSETEVDVVVVGSGAAGLTAALSAAVAGARTLVVESSAELGGTTALSGGRVWIPANGRPENAGDSEENANRYLDQVFDTRYTPMIRTFVHEALQMADFVEEHTPHRFVVCPNYPDYHPDLEGATLGGRCFDVAPVDVGALVPEVKSLREPPGYTPITHAEWEQWRYPARIDHDLLAARRAAGVRTGGVGLAAALLDGVIRAGVQMRSGTTLVGVVVTDGGVTGVRLRTADGELTVTTRSVVLACGGFDAAEDKRGQLLPPGLGVSASAPGDTGIALALAEELGLATDNLGEGWWMPMALPEGDLVEGVPYPRGMVRERGAPRQILVDRHGRRFLDEALPYNEFGKAMHRPGHDGEPAGLGAHLVFDEGFRARYPLPGLSAEGGLPAHIVVAGDLPGLGRQIGVGADELVRTVDRWNASCVEGVDRDFGRGSNPYDVYYGDPDQEPNPCLGPLDRPPYYAMRVYSGVIGSKGGPVTDTAGRVLDRAGAELPGLYAAGNAAAFWTGDGYPGPGATLAVAMTFGHLAGRHAARAGPRV